MNDERRIEALSHMLQSARLACSYVEGMSKADFLADTRTQQGVIARRFERGDQGGIGALGRCGSGIH